MAEKKLTVLEIYQQKGWLNRVNSRWSADDRVNSGIWLRNIHEKAGLGKISAINYEKERIDCSMKPQSEFAQQNEVLFFKITSYIPKEFRQLVIDVCCDDKRLKARGKTINEKKNDRYLKIVDLCRGLDYVVEFRLFEKKKYNFFK